ncbi:MAG: hypothetical protein ABSF32_03120 [Ignavibacteria bacterium]|jgi:hypothetical protein
MKLIISTIVGAIIFFVLGWILYGMIFMNFFRVHYGAIMRSPDDYKMWAILVANVLEAFFLAWIYPKGYKGGSPAGEGFKFGFYIGLLMAVPYVFYTWAEFPITYVTAIVDAIIMFVMVVIVGLVIGLIYGKGAGKEVPKETTA